MLESLGIERAKRIEQTLKESGLEYNGQVFNLLVGPEPFFLEEEQLSFLKKRAPYYKEWLRVSNELYSKALTDSQFGWIAELVEGGAPKEVVKVQRKIFEKGLVPLPLLGRADQPSLGSTVEMQIPGFGWGYMHEISQVFAWFWQEDRPWGEGLDVGFVRAMQVRSGKRYPQVVQILSSERTGYLQEVKLFNSYCGLVRGRMKVVLGDELTTLKEVDIIRRPTLQGLLHSSLGEKVIALYLNGEIQIEPPPNLLYDQKVAMVLPFHPQTAEFFSDGVRELFPETHLVAREWLPSFGGEELSWEEIPELPPSKRPFVLKYAGFHSAMRGGGRAVFNLQKTTRHQIRPLLEEALSGWNRIREPWILQRWVKEKFPVTLFDGTGLQEVMWYMRLTPMYFLGENPTIIGGAANFRNFWKVSGREGSLVLAVHVK